MCSCKHHHDENAPCTCICDEPGHRNFDMARDLAMRRYDEIRTLKEQLAKAPKVLLERRGGEPTLCKVYLGGEVIFDGVDHSALIAARPEAGDGMSESQTEPLELDEVGVLEWRVYELEGRLASLAYDQTKALAARPQVVPCVRCSHPTTRSSLVCIFCEHGTKGRSPLPET